MDQGSPLHLQTPFLPRYINLTLGVTSHCAQVRATLKGGGLGKAWAQQDLGMAPSWSSTIEQHHLGMAPTIAGVQDVVATAT
jgi:hypothetical protein